MGDEIQKNQYSSTSIQQLTQNSRAKIKKYNEKKGRDTRKTTYARGKVSAFTAIVYVYVNCSTANMAC
jgi:hypothetical protein